MSHHRQFLIFFFVFSWIAVQPAWSNIRAPITLHHPSGALKSPLVNLTVQQANVTIACREDCTITADYRILSHIVTSTILEFIQSENNTVQVKVNERSVQVSRSLPFTLENEPVSRSDRPRLEYTDTLYRVSFPVHFMRGINRISIRYIQSPGLDERKFSGYFSGWQVLHEVRYELWPLREWHLGKNFFMGVLYSIYLDNPKKEGVLVRTFKTTKDRPQNRVLLHHPANPVLYRQRWKHCFPARLEVLYGSMTLLEDSQFQVIPDRDGECPSQ